MPEGNLWLFWSRSPGGPLKRGLVVWLQACGNRECDCRDVVATVFPVSEGLKAVEEKGGKLVFIHEAGQEEVAAPVDLAISYDSGEVSLFRPEKAGAGAEEVRAWVAAEMDGEALENLHATWLRARRWRLPEKPRPGPWTEEPPGSLIGWSEAVPGGRHEIFVLPEGVFVAEDLYCIRPDCICRSMNVSVALLQEGPEVIAVGTIVVELPSCTAQDFEVHEGSEEDLRRVWKALDRRHDLRKIFPARAARMKEAGVLLRHEVAARSPKAVGRNDPCPCGSGKKYKKCCLQRAS